MNQRMAKMAIGVIMGCALVCISGCATPRRPQPLSYAAVNRPAGKIVPAGQAVRSKHSRGGFYFFNAGFRPAADVASYLQKAQADTNTEILTNADVELHVPFALDILLFGYNKGTDTVSAGQ